jgi:hypothetical protein
MSAELDQITTTALTLSREERGKLAERLLASLEGEEDLEDPEIVERAWIDEVKRRQERFIRGEIREVPADEALARVRAGLRSA